MSDKVKITSLKPISEVVRVYSGRPGCACGCRGKYYPSSKNDVLTKKEESMIGSEV